MASRPEFLLIGSTSQRVLLLHDRGSGRSTRPYALVSEPASEDLSRLDVFEHGRALREAQIDKLSG